MERFPYDDGYPTCKETFATLRILTGELDPVSVTERLGMEPTRVQRRGERRYPHRPHLLTKSAWFLSSQGVTASLDVRRHVDILLDRVEPRAAVLRELQERAGVEMDLSGVRRVECVRECPWGPSTSINQAHAPVPTRDGALRLEIEIQSGDVLVVDADRFSIEMA